jgi:hypothetical protein
MNQRYRKTDAGRAEIRERRLDLPRPARNLLLIIDDGKPAAEWVGLVAGAGPADLQRLLDAGLVAAVQAPPPRAAAPAPAPANLAPDLEAAGFRALYDYLTSQARPRLGLVKGYRAVLDIERCSGVEELRRYALNFVELVREADGDDAARRVALELSALR